jgi:hypothetical protein
MKYITAVSVLGAASAFAPAQQASRSQTQLNVKKDGDMSKALPFAQRPKLLDGELAGDVGFE